MSLRPTPRLCTTGPAWPRGARQASPSKQSPDFQRSVRRCSRAGTSQLAWVHRSESDPFLRPRPAHHDTRNSATFHAVRGESESDEANPTAFTELRIRLEIIADIHTYISRTDATAPTKEDS